MFLSSTAAGSISCFIQTTCLLFRPAYVQLVNLLSVQHLDGIGPQAFHPQQAIFPVCRVDPLIVDTARHVKAVSLNNPKP